MKREGRKQKWPVVLSATALVVAVLGGAGIAEGVHRAGESSAFSARKLCQNGKNCRGAGAIKVSKRPKAGHLVPLARNKKFPGSVIPKVPSATFADRAGIATTAGRATTATTAGRATSAASADNAGRLDGVDSTGFLRTTGKAADADKLDGVDSSELTRAPRFIDITGTWSASFSSGSENECLGATNYTPPRPQHAVMYVRSDGQVSGAAANWGIRGIYSTNSGGTWSFASPGFWVETGGSPGERAHGTYVGHVDLSAGTPYRFGMWVTRTSGSGTVSTGWCQVMVQIFDRDPAATSAIVETVGSVRQP